jgi:hypothetical protein
VIGLVKNLPYALMVQVIFSGKISIKNNNYEISNMRLMDPHENIFAMFPQIQFYDYTKIPTRKVEHIPNYHLTWSYSEANDKYATLFDKVSNNIAVVFRDALPKMFKGLKVIDGDKHDMRFLDETQVVVGLIEKGEAKKDTSGFVIDLINARTVA